MNKKKKLKCGVVGVGYLGKHHARIYNDLPNVEFVGICEVDDARAEEICSLYKCKRFKTSKELAEACDAVSIVVPTQFHHKVALELLEVGVHLLIEKPICTSLKEAEEIVEAARAKDKVVQVGHIEHFNPVMSYLEEVVTEPKFITADRLAPFNPRCTDVGVVLDLMIHDIGIILQLVKSPILKIEAVGVNVLSKHEDIANARITFVNGAVANLNTSRVSTKKLREIRVFQPQKYLSLDFMNQSGHFMKKEDGMLNREEIPIQRGEPLLLELQSFVDCVIRSANPKVGAALGRQALEVAIQVTEQIESMAAAQHA